MFNKLKLRIRALFHKSQLDNEMDDELRFHMECEIEENIARGMSNEEARYAALRSFGGVERVKEESRDSRGIRFADELWQDVRFGMRVLSKSPGFTLIAVMSLALGIGATTTLFSLVNAILLRPLPIQNAESLVTINKPGANGSLPHAISYPDYLDYRNQTEIFSEILVWTPAELNITLKGPTETANGIVVSGNYFSMLGVKPVLGRFFSAKEDRTPGTHPVIIISYKFWQNRFGGSTSIIGQNVKLNGQMFTIIGVTPKEFTSTYNVYAPSIYVPLMMQAEIFYQPKIFGERMNKYLHVTGRLKLGVSQVQAQEALSIFDRQLEQAYPQQGESARRPNLGVELAPVGSFPGEIQLLIWAGVGLLLVIVGFVLLITCSNVAGMLLVRATSRQREIAVRLALGISRSRLIRQLLTESCLLFFVAGGLGVALTVWLTRIILILALPVDLPFSFNPHVDWRVLSFTLLLIFLTGIIFGFAPALEASRVDLHTISKGGQAIPGTSRSRNVFVIAQIALSITLLIGAGLLTRALEYAQTIYPGKQPDSVLQAELNPAGQGYSEVRAALIYRQLTDRVSALPNVDDVSLAEHLPIAGFYNVTGLTINVAGHNMDLEVGSNIIEAFYFRTLGITVLHGRDFTPADKKLLPRVAIVNESLARQFGPGHYSYWSTS